MGTVVARNEYPVLSPFSGEVVWKIEEGMFVEPGVVIVRFDATQVQEELRQMKEDLFEREEAVRRAKERLKTVQRRSALEIGRQKIAVERAQIRRDTVYGRPTAEERKRSDWNLKRAALKFERSKTTYENYQALFGLGFVTEAVLKKRRLDLLRDKAEHAKQKILNTLTMEGASSDSKRLADLSLEEAKKSQATAEFNGKADQAIASANLELSEINLENFKMELERKERYVNQAECKAPARGRVAFVDVWKGSRQSLSPIQIGESRRRGQDLCKIADTSVLRVRIMVNEADVGRLKTGQQAEIRIPAFRERVFKARVAEVALVAKDKNVALDRLALRRAGEAFVNVVEVLLDFDNLSDQDRGAMRLGFTSEVRIDCKVADGAPSIPWSAVRFDAEGSPFVRARVSRMGSQQRSVKLGVSNDEFVQITEGLDGVEEVLDHARPYGLKETSQPQGSKARGEQP